LIIGERFIRTRRYRYARSRARKYTHLLKRCLDGNRKLADLFLVDLRRCVAGAVEIRYVIGDDFKRLTFRA